MAILSTATTSTIGTKQPIIYRIYNAPELSITGTITYTSTTITKSGANFIADKIKIGNRVSAMRVVTIGADTFNYLSFGFITKIEATILTIDEWSNGIPTNNQTASIDGFGVVLPFPQSIEETFSPDIVTHELLKDRSEVSKIYGYNYSIEIGYDEYLSQDILIQLKQILKYNIEGSAEKLLIVPRKDKIGFNYEVYLDGDITYTPLYYSKLGAKGISFSLRGLSNVAVPSFVGVGGYGTNYGLNYGTTF